MRAARAMSRISRRRSMARDAIASLARVVVPRVVARRAKAKKYALGSWSP
jgi:hypothetical protein